MAQITVGILGTVFIGGFFLRSANRIIHSANVFRSVFWGGAATSHEFADGEPTMVRGTVIVDEFAYEADRVVEDTNSAVALYYGEPHIPIQRVTE